MPGHNKKVTNTSTSLFKFTWPFCYHQALKGSNKTIERDNFHIDWDHANKAMWNRISTKHMLLSKNPCSKQGKEGMVKGWWFGRYTVF